MRKKLLLLFVFSQMLLACNPCDLRYGFPESCFQIAPYSRLPKWFELPQGYSRADIKVTFCYYTPPFMNPRVIMKLRDRSDKVLSEKTGIQRYHPDSEKRGIRSYPIYVIVAVDDVEEVFEHRQRGDIVYITDDPRVTEALKQGKAK